MAYSAQPQVNSHKTDFIPFVRTDTDALNTSYLNVRNQTTNLIIQDSGEKRFLVPRPNITSGGLTPFPEASQRVQSRVLTVNTVTNGFLFYTINVGGLGTTYNIYVYNGFLNTHTLLSSAGTASVDFAEFTFISGQRGVFITGLTGGNSAFYNISTGTFTGGIAPGLSLRSPVVIDNYVFAYRNGTNDINQCNFDNPLVWTAGDFITADLNSGIITRMKKIKNYLAVFKTEGVEFLYNAGNPSGSVLAQYDSFHSVLNLNARSNVTGELDVIEYQDSLIVASQGGPKNKAGLYRITTSSLDLMPNSSPNNNPYFLLNSANLSIFSIYGNPYISVVGGSFQELYYDITNQSLTNFTFGNSPGLINSIKTEFMFPFFSAFPFIILANGTTTNWTTFEPNLGSRSFQDQFLVSGVSYFNCSITLGPIDHGTYFKKRCNKITLEVETAPTTTSSRPIITLSKRFSGDSNWRTATNITQTFRTPVLLGTSTNENLSRNFFILSRIGSYKTAYFTITLDPNTEFCLSNYKLFGLSFDLDIGTF